MMRPTYPDNDDILWRTGAALTGLVIVVVLLTTGMYVFIYVLEQRASPPPDPFPYPQARIDVDPVERRDIPAPALVAITGNATGQQHMAVLDRHGTLSVYSSDDMFWSNMTTTTLATYRDVAVGTMELAMGHVPNGTVAVRATVNGSSRYWVRSVATGDFVESPGAVPVLGPPRPDMGRGDLPASDRIRDRGPPWATMELDGREWAVMAYYYVGGCTEEVLCPCVVYRQPGGEWSSIVVLGRRDSSGLAIAGTGEDDMYIVSWYERKSELRWRFYPITDDSVIEAGRRGVVGG